MSETAGYVVLAALIVMVVSHYYTTASVTRLQKRVAELEKVILNDR